MKKNGEIGLVGMLLMLIMWFVNPLTAEAAYIKDIDVTIERARNLPYEFRNDYYSQTGLFEYVEEDGFYYVYMPEDDCYAVVYRSKDIKDDSYRNINIKSYIKGKPVCVICGDFMLTMDDAGSSTMDEYSFSVESLSIPDTVELFLAGITNMDIKYFYMPDSVRKICRGVIEGDCWTEGGPATDFCTLKDVRYSKNLTAIPGSQYWNTGLMETIYIPEGIIEIEDYAFTWLKKGLKIYIPSSVTKIGKDICGGKAIQKERYTIYCKQNSVAYKYAKDNKIPYKLIKDSDFAVKEISFDEKKIEVGLDRTNVIMARVTPFYLGHDVVSYESANPEVAIVDNQGMIIGVSEGKTEVTAVVRNSKVKATIEVEVKKEVSRKQVVKNTICKKKASTASAKKVSFVANNNKIYSVNNSSGKTKQIAYIKKAKKLKDVVYCKGNLYFTAEFGGKTGSQICKMKTSGQGFTKLGRGCNPNLYNGKIYYIRKDEKNNVLGIGSMSKTGVEKQLLAVDGNISDLYVWGGKMYALTDKDAYNDKYISAYNIYGEYLGFAGVSEENFYDKFKVYHVFQNEVYLQDIVTSKISSLQIPKRSEVVGVLDGYVYYSKTKYIKSGKVKSSVLYKKKIKNKSKEIKLATFNGKRFESIVTTAGNWIIFTQASTKLGKKTTLVKMKKDGTGKATIP